MILLEFFIVHGYGVFTGSLLWYNKDVYKENLSPNISKVQHNSSDLTGPYNNYYAQIISIPIMIIIIGYKKSVNRS